MTQSSFKWEDIIKFSPITEIFSGIIYKKKKIKKNYLFAIEVPNEWIQSVFKKNLSAFFSTFKHNTVMI